MKFGFMSEHVLYLSVELELKSFLVLVVHYCSIILSGDHELPVCLKCWSRKVSFLGFCILLKCPRNLAISLCLVWPSNCIPQPFSPHSEQTLLPKSNQPWKTVYLYENLLSLAL